jgi:hypothetical protein
MHYKNGREARNGDKVILIDPNGGLPTVGILIDAKAECGSDCNGNIAQVTQFGLHYADLKNCLHVDDVRAAFENHQTPPPSEPIEKRAGRMYEAYARAVGGKAFNGDVLPDWDTFQADPSKELQHDAWIAVAQA